MKLKETETGNELLIWIEKYLDQSLDRLSRCRNKWLESVQLTSSEQFSKSEEDPEIKASNCQSFQTICKYSEFLANFCSINLICYKWASRFYFQNELLTY